MTYEDIKSALDLLAEQHSLNQLARKIGVPYPTFRRFFIGKDVRVSTLLKIEKYVESIF